MEKSDTNTNENLTWNHKDQGRSVREGGDGCEGVSGARGAGGMAEVGVEEE